MQQLYTLLNTVDYTVYGTLVIEFIIVLACLVYFNLKEKRNGKI